MNQLQKKMDNVLQKLHNIIQDIKEENLQNSQEVIDFMDKLNVISITF
jgi:hypothetical protein